jgi:hypothetical protein
MEREEKERKDELHAFQSGEERAGDASEGLALEQLWFLFQNRNKFVRAESGVEAEELKSVKEQELKSKTRTLHTPKDSAPPRVLIVHGLTPVPRRRVGHPPIPMPKAWLFQRSPVTGYGTGSARVQDHI